MRGLLVFALGCSCLALALLALALDLVEGTHGQPSHRRLARTCAALSLACGGLLLGVLVS